MLQPLFRAFFFADSFTRKMFNVVILDFRDVEKISRGFQNRKMYFWKKVQKEKNMKIDKEMSLFSTFPKSHVFSKSTQKHVLCWFGSFLEKKISNVRGILFLMPPTLVDCIFWIFEIFFECSIFTRWFLFWNIFGQCEELRESRCQPCPYVFSEENGKKDLLAKS